MASNVPGWHEPFNLMSLMRHFSCVYAESPFATSRFKKCKSDFHADRFAFNIVGSENDRCDRYDIGLHMLDCLHAVCRSCYKADLNAGYLVCVSCGMTSHRTRFFDSLHMTQLYRLFNYSFWPMVRCEECNIKLIKNGGQIQCMKCKGFVCQNVSLDTHKCKEFASGLKANRDKDYAELYGFDRILTMCAECPMATSAQDQTGRFMCNNVLHLECGDRLYCEEHCKAGGHIAKEINVEEAKDYQDKVYTNVIKKIVELPKSLREISEHHADYSKSAQEFIQPIIDEHFEDVAIYSDFGWTRHNIEQIRDRKCKVVEGLRKLEQWALIRGRGKLHEDIRERRVKMESLDNEIELKTKLLKFYRSAKFHIELLRAMCEGYPEIEAYAWDSIAVAYNAATDNNTSDPKFE